MPTPGKLAALALLVCAAALALNFRGSAPGAPDRAAALLTGSVATAASASPGPIGGAQEAKLYSLNKGIVRIYPPNPLEIWADATYDYKAKHVSVTWHYRGTQDQVLNSTQVEAVRFFPTEVASDPSGALLVAGWFPATGDVTVERWQFGAIPEQFFAGFDSTTGELVEPYVQVPVRSKTTVFSSTGSWDPIRSLFSLRHTNGHLLVQYLMSAAVAEVNPDTDAVTTLWSPGPEGLTLPELANVDGHRWSADQDQAGYVYMLGKVLLSDDVVYFLDSDRDGAIDTGGAYTPAEVEDAGILDGSHLLTWF